MLFRGGMWIINIFYKLKFFIILYFNVIEFFLIFSNYLVKLLGKFGFYFWIVDMLQIIKDLECRRVKREIIMNMMGYLFNIYIYVYVYVCQFCIKYLFSIFILIIFEY